MMVGCFLVFADTTAEEKEKKNLALGAFVFCFCPGGCCRGTFCFLQSAR